MDKIIPIKKSKVLIVDDHPIVREGLIQLINRQNDLEVLKAVEDAETALATVKATRPDIILVDLSLKGTGGLELIKQINDLDEAIPVLVLSMHDEALYAERSLRAGARGYIMKQEATNRLLEAIRKVLEGEIHVSDRVAAKLVEGLVAGGKGSWASPLEALSDRELEVFELIGKGMSSRTIAETLDLSVKTVDTYRARIKEKLHLEDRAELVHRAIEWIQSGSRA